MKTSKSFNENDHCLFVFLMFTMLRFFIVPPPQKTNATSQTLSALRREELSVLVVGISVVHWHVQGVILQEKSCQ